jgi:hypothetical protein
MTARKLTSEQFTETADPRVVENKNFNKVFCIGYNKTGTTTLQTLLKIYGFRMPNQMVQEIRLTETVHNTDYNELLHFCSEYDAFQDMPFSQGLTFAVVDALFPNSKFILTERDADSWFNSMCNFHKKVYQIDDLSLLTEKDILEKFNYLYPGYLHQIVVRNLSKFEGDTRKVLWEKLYDYEYYTADYKKRNEDIKRHFLNVPEKLLVIDVTKEKDTQKICDFLQIPLELIIDMPHSNKT